MPIYEEKEKIDGQKRYYVRTYVEVDGKKKQITKHNKLWLGLEGKREAQRYENILVDKPYVRKKLYFKELADEFLNTKQKEVKYSTYEKLINAINIYMLDFFQNKDTYNLTSKDILNWHDYINTTNLSYYTKKYLHTTLSSILNYGCMYYNVEKNVASLVGNFKKIKGNIKEMQFLTKDEFNRFIKFEDNQLYRSFFTILFYTGMRRGELLALTKNDINGNEISINKTKNPKLKINQTTSPKTDKSNRKIKVLGLVKDELDKLDDDMFKEIILTTLKRKCDRNCKLAEINKNIRIHDFRHSFASMCINEDIPINIISNYLGHENVTTTWNTYAHLYPNSQDKLLSKLEKQDQKQD